MKVLVKDLIEYLSKLPPEAEVGLDKDGWMENDIPHNGNVQKLIEDRGVFYRGTYLGEEYLTINN